MSEEVEAPRQTMPVALVAGVALVTAVYLMVTVALLLATPVVTGGATPVIGLAKQAVVTPVSAGQPSFVGLSLATAAELTGSVLIFFGLFARLGALILLGACGSDSAPLCSEGDAGCLASAAKPARVLQARVLQARVLQGSATSASTVHEVRIDGELVEWVNGGATTALHEAAHTWGLDHVDTERTIMFPTGNNEPTAFGDGCYAVVADVDLSPGTASCPELNAELCDAEAQQNATAVLRRLFGGSYVDVQAPVVKLVEPADGQYFQAPASFDVVLDIRDDLHPQVYQAAFWLGDQAKPEATPFIEDHISVVDLPVGSWAFHVELTDEAGNATRLDFEIEVGEDPPPEPHEGGCRVSGVPRGGVSGLLALVWLLLPALARRRGPR